MPYYPSQGISVEVCPHHGQTGSSLQLDIGGKAYNVYGAMRQCAKREANWGRTYHSNGSVRKVTGTRISFGRTVPKGLSVRPADAFSGGRSVHESCSSLARDIRVNRFVCKARFVPCLRAQSESCTIRVR